jgi:uncharacterized protein YjiS (DUF1127 family)
MRLDHPAAAVRIRMADVSSVEASAGVHFADPRQEGLKRRVASPPLSQQSSQVEAAKMEKTAVTSFLAWPFRGAAWILVRILRAGVRTFVDHRERVATTRALLAMDDHVLKDIGVSRLEVDFGLAACGRLARVTPSCLSRSAEAIDLLGRSSGPSSDRRLREACSLTGVVGLG